jgi:integrase/recombinase XerD
MEKNYSISIYLDTRREIKDSQGKYPIKLRLFTNHPRKQKLYATKFQLTKAEYDAICLTRNPRKEEYKKTRRELIALETHANQVAEKLNRFSIEAFERKMLNRPAGDQDVAYYYLQVIDNLKRNNQISTADSYELSLKSLLEFHDKEHLMFYDITPQWLRDYEEHMLTNEDKPRSKTTVGIYLRYLRAVFNNAIEDEIISRDDYPFGKRKYSIPNPRGVKKALTREQLKTLFEAVPATPEQEKAKSFWFFSYSCNGMNFKDIAGLQYKNITADTLIFSRAKTASSNASQAPVKVYLTEFAKGVIQKYGNPDKSPKSYIFPIIDHKAAPEEKHRQLKNFVRYVNQHFLKFAKKAGINEKISTYWARHSFATNAIRSGASMEYVSEALSHSNLGTTKNYFAGFEDEKKKEIANKLMEF